MTTPTCPDIVAIYLERPLTPDEKALVDYLCAYRFPELDIAALIASFLFNLYIAQIEKKLGRKLSAEERKKAWGLFKKGVPAKDAAQKIEPEPPTSTFSP